MKSTPEQRSTPETDSWCGWGVGGLEVVPASCARKLERERDAAIASHALLAPFVAVAKGIPDNWPGECILRFDQRNDGSIYLSYHGINDASHGITINQWRALLGANLLLSSTSADSGLSNHD
jgi:hypothetical protein